MIAYVAGPYRNSPEGVERAIRFAKTLWANGIATICPHANSLQFEEEIPFDDTFLAGYLEILKRCDEVYVLPGWERSLGTLEEMRLAEALGIKIWYVLETEDGFVTTSAEEVSVCD